MFFSNFFANELKKLDIVFTPSYLKVFDLLERGSPNRTTSGLTTP